MRSFITNRDAFLTSYEGALGIKTGFTGNAGYCFVGAARRDNKTFVSVVLASGWPPHKTYKWKDTKILMDFGMDNYEKRTVMDENYSLQDIPVQEGIQKESVSLSIEDTISLLMRQDEEVYYVEQLAQVLEAPVQKGDIAGTIDVYIDDVLYESIVVYIGENVERINYKYIFQQILKRYFLIY